MSNGPFRNMRFSDFDKALPDWVDKKSVKSTLNEKEVKPFWASNYLVFKDLSAGDPEGDPAPAGFRAQH